MGSSAYETLFAKLDAHSTLPALTPHQPFDIDLSAAIQSSDLPRWAVCGLLIWNEDYQTAHPIAQAMKDADGSYWHGIIHRMEADYWNAKYWFKSVGNHPVLLAMAQFAEAKPFLSGGKWNPALFVDACERVSGQKLNDELLRHLQLAELKALLAHCLENDGNP